MNLRFRLPGGLLKIKTARYLRTAEVHREVPVFRMGRCFLIWWPKGRLNGS